MITVKKTSLIHSVSYYLFRLLDMFTTRLNTVVLCKFETGLLLSIPIKGIYKNVDSLLQSKKNQTVILNHFKQEITEEQFLKNQKVEFSILAYTYMLINTVIPSTNNEDTDPKPKASDSLRNN